jgi:hypothetical protein
MTAKLAILSDVRNGLVKLPVDAQYLFEVQRQWYFI